MAISVAFFDLGDTLVRNPPAWISGAKAALSDLRGRNIKLGIISNTGQLTRQQVLQLLPADFDLGIFEPTLVILSSEVGVEKPSLGIFQLAIHRAGVDASRCLFCTESLTDSLAAANTGMIAARVQKPPASDINELVTSLRDAKCIV